jgi:hypothetical protein
MDGFRDAGVDEESTGEAAGRYLVGQYRSSGLVAGSAVQGDDAELVQLSWDVELAGGRP